MTVAEQHDRARWLYWAVLRLRYSVTPRKVGDPDGPSALTVARALALAERLAEDGAVSRQPLPTAPRTAAGREHHQSVMDMHARLSGLGGAVQWATSEWVTAGILAIEREASQPAPGLDVEALADAFTWLHCRLAKMCSESHRADAAEYARLRGGER
jgi:hypothetical protein